MNVLVADLDEYGSRFRQEIPSNSQSVAKVCEIAMYPVPPGVAKGFDLFGLAGDVRDVAVLHVATRSAPLEIAVEFDPVRRVDIDTLHLPAQTLALRQAGHHLE